MQIYIVSFPLTLPPTPCDNRPNSLAAEIFYASLARISFAFHPCDHLHHPHEVFTNFWPWCSCILCRTILCCCTCWCFSYSCITCRWNSYTWFNIHSIQGHFHPWGCSSYLIFHPCRCRPGCKISWLTCWWNCKYPPFLTLRDFSSPKSHPCILVTVQNLGVIICRSYLLGYVT